jgi:hypothetical protein
MGELSTSPPPVVDSDLAELLSPSQVRCFMDCQVRWWFKYGLKFPDSPNGKMVLGRAVHAALTQNLQKLDTYEDFLFPESRDIPDSGLQNGNRRNSEMTKTQRTRACGKTWSPNTWNNKHRDSTRRSRDARRRSDRWHECRVDRSDRCGRSDHRHQDGK